MRAAFHAVGVGTLPQHASRPHGCAAFARLAGRVVAKTLVAAARTVTGAETRWIGCVPSQAPRVYIANHTSHADFILLWSSLPPRLRSLTHPVAAADYWERGIVRRYLAKQVFQAVLVERERAKNFHNPLAPMLRALDDGHSLIVFPEGTRGNGAELLPFKCGIYHLALERPGVEVVPVWIDNLHRVLPRGAILPAPLLCSVTFGAPVGLLPGEEKKAFLARLRQNVALLGSRTGPARPSEPSGSPEDSAERLSGNHGSVSRASSSVARTGPARPSEPPGSPEDSAERLSSNHGSVVRASSSIARTGPARPSEPSGSPEDSAERLSGNQSSVSRASSSIARTGPARPSEPPGSPEDSAERLSSNHGSVSRASSLVRTSHNPPEDVAHAPTRAVSRLFSTLRRAVTHRSEPERRQEWRRGTQSACATSLSGERCGLEKARTVPARPPEPSGPPDDSAESGSVVWASSSEVQWVRRAPPSRPSNRSRRTPFCARSSEESCATRRS